MPPETSAGKGVHPVGAVVSNQTLARRTTPDGPVHVWKFRPTSDHDSVHFVEPELTTQQVIGIANHVNALGAVDIVQAFSGMRSLDIPLFTAIRRLEESGLRFHVNGITNGNGQESSSSYTSVIINPLHGGGNAVSGREGSMSVIAGVVNGELARVPDEDEAKYMDRVIASPRARRLGASGISVDADVNYNVRALMRAYRLSSPKEVDAIVLGSSVNEEVIEELRSAGTNPRVVDTVDLIPVFTALLADKPMIVIGKGDKRDSVTAAVAAKATGGLFEVRYTDENGKPVDSVFGRRQTADTLVSGNKSDTFISLASITGTNIGIEGPLSGLRGVVQVNRSVSEPKYNVMVGSVDGATGFFKQSILPL